MDKIKMDTPKIPGKIGKYQLSVFFKSTWVVFSLIFCTGRCGNYSKMDLFFLNCVCVKRGTSGPRVFTAALLKVRRSNGKAHISRKFNFFVKMHNHFDRGYLFSFTCRTIRFGLILRASFTQYRFEGA